jgi:hypothetical protein
VFIERNIHAFRGLDGTRDGAIAEEGKETWGERLARGGRRTTFMLVIHGHAKAVPLLCVSGGDNPCLSRPRATEPHGGVPDQRYRSKGTHDTRG